MIDLETMGLRPTSAILSIGAVRFDESHSYETFHQPILLASCYDAGLTFDQSTVDWWAKQSVEARQSWQNDAAVPLTEALTRFVRWLESLNGPIAPWGNGADFDLVLLKSAFEAIGADVPWKFWDHHCFRTVKNLFKVGPMPRTGTYHNALDDALTQAAHFHRISKVHGVRLS